MSTIFIKNKEELQSFSKTFLEQIKEKFKSDMNERAVVIGLQGDLGSGKTTFSQTVAKVLGVDEMVTSPTFVIEKKYKTTDPVFGTFVHIDAYRLEEDRELAVLEFEKDVNTPNTLIFIEWPEKVEEILPKNLVKLSFKFIDETTREIEY